MANEMVWIEKRKTVQRESNEKKRVQPLFVCQQWRNNAISESSSFSVHGCQCTQCILSLIRTKEFTKYEKTGFSQFHLSTLMLSRQENKNVSEVNRNQQQSTKVRNDAFWNRKALASQAYGLVGRCQSCEVENIKRHSSDSFRNAAYYIHITQRLKLTPIIISRALSSRSLGLALFALCDW